MGSMDINDIKVGDTVAIGARFFGIGLFGYQCEVLKVVPPLPEYAEIEDFPYPHGVVTVRLPEHADWPIREVHIGPEDLGKIPGTGS